MHVLDRREEPSPADAKQKVPYFFLPTHNGHP
jgi:hypothetical protein